MKSMNEQPQFENPQSIFFSDQLLLSAKFTPYLDAKSCLNLRATSTLLFKNIVDDETYYKHLLENEFPHAYYYLLRDGSAKKLYKEKYQLHTMNEALTRAVRIKSKDEFIKYFDTNRFRHFAELTTLYAPKGFIWAVNEAADESLNIALHNFISQSLFADGSAVTHISGSYIPIWSNHRMYRKDFNENSILVYAIILNQPESLRDKLKYLCGIDFLLLNKNNNGDTLLHFAYASGNQQIIDILQTDGRSNANSVNKFNMTAFDIACYFGHLHLIKHELESSAAPYQTLLEKVSINHGVGFQFAAALGYQDILMYAIEILLSANCLKPFNEYPDVIKETIINAIHLSAEYGYEETYNQLIQLLIEHRFTAEDIDAILLAKPKHKYLHQEIHIAAMSEKYPTRREQVYHTCKFFDNDGMRMRMTLTMPGLEKQPSHAIRYGFKR